MLYVFSILVVATLLLSVMSLDELAQRLAELPSVWLAAGLLLLAVLAFWVWRSRRKK